MFMLKVLQKHTALTPLTLPPHTRHPRVLQGKHFNSLGKLDAVQERAYKRKHRQGFVMKRAELALSGMLSVREIRLFERGGDSKVKAGEKRLPKCVQRHR